MEKIIAELLSEYSAWRSSKKVKNERIPNKLIDSTIKIQKQFPDLKLRSMLKISNTSWNKIINESSFKKLNIDKAILKKDSFLKINGNIQDSSPVTFVNNLEKAKEPVLVMSMTINNIQIKIFN
jgi:hypothetical protein